MDEPYEFEPNANLLIIVLPKELNDDEQRALLYIAESGLEKAYEKHKIDYSLERTKGFISDDERCFRETIESAFAGNPYPGDDRITTHEDSGAAVVRACFCGKTWREHSPALLEYCGYALAIFTEDALFYFLPAFLIVAVEHPDTSDSILGWLLRLFIQRPRLADRDAFVQRISRLTRQQRDVLVQVFRHLQSRSLYSQEHVDMLLEIFNSHPSAV